MEPVEISEGHIKVDWDAIKDMSKKTVTKRFDCKKCGVSFLIKIIMEIIHCVINICLKR